MRHVRHVRQKHRNGCMVAALAMLTGATYEAVEHALGDWFDKKNGVTDGDMLAYLVEYGYGFKVNRDPAKLEDVQLAVVRVCDNLRHAVLAFSDGSIFDPAGESNHLSDYEEFCFSVSLI